MKPTLKTGCSAYADTLTLGLVPCKVRSIRQVTECGVVTVRVAIVFTRDRGWAHKGDVWFSTPTHIVPRAAVLSRKLGNRILPYNVELDK